MPPNKEPVGGYDHYWPLMDRYGWTPEEICRMDPELIEEALVRIRADADVEAARRKREEARNRARARQGPAMRGMDVMDADLEDIR
jgi:hypothetical protein